MQVALGRGGRNRKAKHLGALPTGISEKDHAYWKGKESHWAAWSKDDRDAKLKETAPQRHAAREVFETEQIAMEDKPTPIPTQVIHTTTARILY